MPQIFLSYSRKDADFMHRLRDDLIAAGLDVWTDETGLELGTPAWTRAIEQAIDTCACLVAIFSPDAKRSRWVREELDYAGVCDKKVFAVWLRGSQREAFPFGYSAFQVVDARSDYAGALAKLIAALRKHLDLEPPAAPPPARTRSAEPQAPPKPPIIQRASGQNVVQIGEVHGHVEIGQVVAPSASAKTPSPVRPAIPIPELVIIPAGPFLMGSDPQKDKVAREQDWAKDELPQITVTLPKYRIGRYPVTVAEYRAFVDAGGYAERRWWTDAGWTWREENGITRPKYWDDEQWAGDPRLPVVGVSWYEAWAYTQWLNAQLVGAQHAAPLPPGHVFRLPTEAEWEKAARGTDGRIYPWGDTFAAKKCNTTESGIGHTTPVGRFSPAGDSPYGCADMAGNVFEWCLTKHGWHYSDGVNAADNNPEGTAFRVWRGVPWYGSSDGARVAFRDFTSKDRSPDYRGYGVGFRVAVAPLPRP